MAVVSSCREMLELSPATSATLALSCHHSVGHSRGTAGDKPEEGGDDVKSSWPLQAGLHTCYNGGDRGTRMGNHKQISKSRLSSDCTLQLECMKLESLVIADQHAAVNTFPGLVHTARHTMGVGFTRRRSANLPRKLDWRRTTTVGSATGVK